MKIVISIVTYKNESHLNKNLETLFQSDVMSYNPHIEIINNHSNFKLREEFKDKVSVIHNTVRPDWSTGHIARDYNSAYVRHFKSLVTPAVDWVITSHDDVVWKPNWAYNLFDVVVKQNGFNLVTSGNGDSVVALQAEALRNTGLYDERFACIGWYEGDMWNRCVMWNRERSSINDHGHGRVHNPSDNGKIGWAQHQPAYGVGRLDSIFITQPYSNEDQATAISERDWTSQWAHAVWDAKWGSVRNTHWPTFYSNPPTRPVGDSYVFYPYFEKDVYDLEKKGYITPNTHGLSSI